MSYQSSGIGVWFEREIENMLKSIDAANDAAIGNVMIYRRGFRDAINTIAIAFNLEYRSTESGSIIIEIDGHEFEVDFDDNI